MFGYSDPNTGIDKSEHAQYTYYFINSCPKIVFFTVFSLVLNYLRQNSLRLLLYPPNDHDLLSSQTVVTKAV